MSGLNPPLTIGIEEEYLIVDPETRDVVVDPPDGMMRECEALVDTEMGAVVPEFLRAQIEVGTAVCGTVAEARDKLRDLRRCVARATNSYGLAPIAASTHPFAVWHRQIPTDKERYHVLARDMQAVAHRLLICGMHVHVGFDDDELRVDLMNQAVYFLPHILVLSTSSPFWQGIKTGLMSYRISVFDELPRTGLPERFDSFREYCRHLDALTEAGLIEDASKIWWDIRPHARFPTIEMRIADVCTRLDDGITVAAMFLCVLSALLRLRRNNQRWREYSNMLINENRWRAQRYGFSQGLVDFGKGQIVPYPDLLEELIELVRLDAQEHACLAEIENARNILARGTSAHRQIAIYDEAIAEGADEPTALSRVVDWLIAETVAGIDAGPGLSPRDDQHVTA
ncbi:MAG: carboxylate-amine ligase [Alphaproteobacteria bacterium]